MPKLKMKVDRVVNGKPLKANKLADVAEPFFSLMVDSKRAEPENTKAVPGEKAEDAKASDK